MSNNKYRGKKIEFHIIQSFPVTCLNRDDVGSPKTAIVGGATRARVSSQCWKRQVRHAMHDFGVQLAVRTKHIKEKIAGYCVEFGADEASAGNAAEKIAEVLSKDTLHFFTESEARSLAEYAREKQYNLELKDKKDKNEVIKIHKKAFTPALDGFDIALFGRMVAQAADLTVEAAAAFSHAISTHKISNEVEFFTALDDFPVDEEKQAGSSHMGSLEFNSATYYRYVSIDLGQLYKTVEEEEAMLTALDAFIKALYVAVPSARQTTQAGFVPWDYAKVYIRKGQRLQASFDAPVKSKGEGYSKPSIEALNTFLDTKEKQSGSLFGKIATFELGETADPNYSIDNLLSDIRQAIEKA